MPSGTRRRCWRLLAVAAVWFVYYRRRDRLELAFAAAIAGVLAFAKVLSPQYLVWLIPLVPFGGVAAGALFVAALALAQSWYFHYQQLWAVGRQVWTLLARNVLLVALYTVPLVEDEHAVAREDEPPVRALAQTDERRRGRERRRHGRRSSTASRRRPPTSRRRASAG